MLLDTGVPGYVNVMVVGVLDHPGSSDLPVPPFIVTMAKGAADHVPSAKVRVMVGFAAWPVPQLVTVIVKRWSVPDTEETDASLPQPGDKEKFDELKGDPIPPPLSLRMPVAPVPWSRIIIGTPFCLNLSWSLIT